MIDIGQRHIDQPGAGTFQSVIDNDTATADVINEDIHR